MTDLTPRDDAKKKVSEILKRVDQLLKASELDQASQQLGLAKEVDPKNVYIHAYEERMAAMLKEKAEMDVIEAKRKAEEEEKRKEEEAKRKVEEERKRVQDEARRKVEEEQHRKEEERKRAEEEQRRRKEEERRKREEEEEEKERDRRKVEDLRRQKEKEREEEEETVKKIEERRKEWAESEAKPRRVREEPREKAPEPAERVVPDIPRSALEETKRKILEDRKKQGAPDLKIGATKTFRHAYDEGLEIYRRVIVEVWADGAATPDEEEQLKGLRASLMIVPEDHARLEREAKTEAYSSAFRRAWSSGAITPESASSLAELRRKFRINIEEHEQIEAKLLWELRSSSQKAQILIIDDDARLLKLISDTLQDAGFQTIAFTTSDEAFSFLKASIPDLILSDINLETSTMGGFTFYEKVREIERLQEIPFIFLTGLTDEVLIRTGKELGVDDYLTKPFSEDILLATIKGKLKRYRQIRKSRQKK